MHDLFFSDVTEAINAAVNSNQDGMIQLNVQDATDNAGALNVIHDDLEISDSDEDEPPPQEQPQDQIQMQIQVRTSCNAKFLY